MKAVIVKYNAGNTRSVVFALRRLGVEPLISNDAEEIRTADKVFLPGVGEASSAMNCLQAGGLDHVLSDLQQPVLGICLGMQLMCSSSEEGATTCLGITDQPVLRFSSPSLKVPQIGWNRISDLRGPLFRGIAEGSWMYFVHSYYVPAGAQTVATANYGISYSCALQKDNFYGVQFHPEKSAEAGQLLLENFLAL